MAFEIAIDLTGKAASGFIKETHGGAEESRIERGPDALASLLKCIEEGARKWGCSAQDLLRKTRSVTLRAPEIITDTLANKNGSRIGLIVSKGHEKKAYFEGHGENPAIDSIVAKDMIVGIKEEVSDRGKAVLEPSAVEVKERVRVLLELGSGIVAVSLKNAGLNGANEGLVKEIIESDYPRHYLGAVPVLAASDFSGERDDFLRTNVCLLNAYTWFNLDHFLRRVESFLQKNGYNYNLLVTQADGNSVFIHGVTPLKTSASDQIAFIKSVFG
jgi:hypothetical protein